MFQGGFSGNRLNAKSELDPDLVLGFSSPFGKPANYMFVNFVSDVE